MMMKTLASFLTWCGLATAALASCPHCPNNPDNPCFGTPPETNCVPGSIALSSITWSPDPPVVCAGSTITASVTPAVSPGRITVISTDACCCVSTNTQPDTVQTNASYAVSGVVTKSGSGLSVSFSSPTSGTGRVTFTLIGTATCPVTGGPATRTGGYTFVKAEITGPSTVTRGENATFSCSVTPAGLNPTFSWKFTGGGQTIDKDTGTVNSWSGVMVVGGTIYVDVKVAGNTVCSLNHSVSVTKRTWLTVVGMPRVDRSLELLPDLLGYTAPIMRPEWLPLRVLQPFDVTVSKIADLGPNDGFTYATAPPVSPSAQITIDVDLNNPNSDFSLAQGNATDIQVVAEGQPAPPGSGVIIEAGSSGRLNIDANPSRDDYRLATKIYAGLNNIAETAVNNGAELDQASMLDAVERHEGVSGNTGEDSHWTRWYNIVAGSTPGMNETAEEMIGTGTEADLKTAVASALNTMWSDLVNAYNAAGHPSYYQLSGKVVDINYPDPTFPAQYSLPFP